MRKGARTLRGQLTPSEIRQLVVDDGIFTNGLRITYFTVWMAEFSTSLGVGACLSLNDAIAPAGGDFPANDPACFAWAAQFPGSSNNQFYTWERLDPDHIVNEELFIHNRGTQSLNYLIIAEPYTMTEDEGVLQLVKGKQQSV